MPDQSNKSDKTQTFVVTVFQKNVTRKEWVSGYQIKLGILEERQDLKKYGNTVRVVKDD